jgi:hypothetical protein
MLAKLAASQAVQSALTMALDELSSKGPGVLVETTVNYAAYRIAYHMVQLEKDMEPKKEKQKEKQEIKLCLVTT